MTTGEIIPRATAAAIVAQRNRALELYGAAHAALVVASEATGQAARAAAQAAPGANSYNWRNEEAKRLFLVLHNDDITPRDDYMAAARRCIDIDVWSHIVQLTDLERLMDKTAKDQLRQQLQEDPPEVTVENIFATLQTFAAEADTIFRRGIAKCFSDLDRRFRSHDGWKIGSRVILSYAFDGWGHWNFYRNHRDTIVDIERAFMVLEGRQQPPNYGGLVGAIEAARRGGWGARQSEIETEYFKVRCYKNGNCHIWFKRDDLVEKVNRLLAEYYGEVIPEERAPQDDGGLNTPKTALAKNYGFFPSPPAVVKTVLEGAIPYREKGEPPALVLEPSAGTGALARAAVQAGAVVDVVEYQAQLAQQLRAQGLYRSVRQADFLSLAPRPIYDVALMNPPFDRERDIDHVMHALKFLKPDGLLVAVMSAGTEFRETRKSRAFRALMEKLRAHWRDLPPASFAESGTNINTLVLRVRADGRIQYW